MPIDTELENEEQTEWEEGKLHLHDVEVSTSAPDFFKVIDDRYILCNDTLIVYQLDHRLIDLLEGELNGIVNGINVCHMTIESGVQQYYEDCKELINYVIFKQQNEIVMGNLFFINERSEYHQMAVKAVKECQRKITKNSYELFPVDTDACFNLGITAYHFTVGYKNDFHRCWFGEEASYSMQEERIVIGPIDPEEEPYASDGKYYEPEPQEEGGDDSGGGGGDEGGDGEGGGEEEAEIIYDEVWNHEYWTIPLKQFYSQSMGVFNSAVQQRTATITIHHKVRPDEYGLVGE